MKNPMPPPAINLENAKQDKLFYFAPTVVVYRNSDGRCLILKRHEREIVGGGQWSVPGGKLERSDLPEQVNRNALENLLTRETREESGLELVPEFKYLRSLTFVRPDGIPVITLSFAARYKAGEVVLEEGSFTDYAWVNETEVLAYDCLGAIKEEVAQAIASFRA